jgi:flagellum-specific peptidoglycan hydrolase FlgJ
MGKSKLYNDAETYHTANESRPNTTERSGSSIRASRARKSAYTPYIRHDANIYADDISLRVLFRVMLARVRRTWIALRWHAQRYGLGVMTQPTTWKIAGVVCAFYYIFFFNGFSNDTGLDTEGRAMGVSLNFFEGRPKKDGAKKNTTALPSNEAAPVSANQLTEEMARDYIARFHAIAQKEMAIYGVPASISLAQGLIESRAGDSKLARNNNNHFGIKCFSRNCKRGHCTNFTDDTHKDFFRKFNSPWESWRAHSVMLSGGRYQKLKKYGRDYRQWAYGLKSVGYATDRTYAEKLIGIIERYDLHQYD